jgi:uncharacterized membrane protein YphA (DoxX/SURF4 family)
MPCELPVRHWRLATRVGFRFCFVYFGLYCLLTQISTSLVPLANIDIPDPSTLTPSRQIVIGTAKYLLHIPRPLVYADTGSGDKTFDWVLLFCLILVAFLATVVWSILDRRRQNYTSLHKWFRLVIRICLAGQMFAYGWMKAIPTQMPYPSLFTLVEPYGHFSPMGVLWSAIGAAPGYEIFAGCAEMLGGILLIFPRTAMLGAMVCLADMTQVFMLNMTYDVPVKLLSFHLILMSLFLLAPDLRRLANFLLLNRTAEPSSEPPLFSTAQGNRVALAAQVLFGIWLVSMNVYGSWSSWHRYSGGRPKSVLYGIWDVSQQTVDGQVRSPLLGDYGRWRRVIFDFRDYATFQHMDDSFAGYRASFKDNTLELTKVKEPKSTAHFMFQRPAGDFLVLDGEMDSHKIHMQLERFDEKKLLLVSRGFHWVQEYPFNR